LVPVGVGGLVRDNEKQGVGTVAVKTDERNQASWVQSLAAFPPLPLFGVGFRLELGRRGEGDVGLEAPSAVNGDVDNGGVM
jgi:hypothetical protein